MKIKAIIAASFAGAGIYFLVTGAVAVVASILMIVSSGEYHEGTAGIMAAEYLPICTPFIVGVVFVTFASRLAAVVCRMANVGGEQIGGLMEPVVVVTVACIVTGLVMVIGEVPHVAQLAYKQFLVAANPAYAAAHRSEDFRTAIILPVLYSLFAVLLLVKAKAVGRWLVLRNEKP